MSYEAKWTKQSDVRIVSLPALEQFRKTWRFHNPLQPDQLQYADQTARVASVGYYHGGDVLYQLEGIPGTWHECCLGPTSSADSRALLDEQATNEASRRRGPGKS